MGLRPVLGRLLDTRDEIGAADNARANFAGITEPHHGEADGREVANALIDFTLARRSWISGTEKLGFSTPMPGALWRM